MFKSLFIFLLLFFATNCLSQPPKQSQSSPDFQPDSNMVFLETFDNNNKAWPITDDRHERTLMDSGFYYITAKKRAYGEAKEVTIDTKRNFEIEARIKIVNGDPRHKTNYSMIFWGREAMNSYYFSFAGDGFSSVEHCTGKNQNSCAILKGSLQKTMLDPLAFNVYRIQKVGSFYSFFVNQTKIYEMPFVPFFGKLIGFGAGKNVTLAVDYLKVKYL